jgi:hypothetical protein
MPDAPCLVLLSFFLFCTDGREFIGNWHRPDTPQKEEVVSSCDLQIDDEMTPNSACTQELQPSRIDCITHISLQRPRLAEHLCCDQLAAQSGGGDAA